MQITTPISNEPNTNFKRIVHYAGLEDYPAIFQSQNIATITIKFVVEYFTGDNYPIKQIFFVFQIDNQTKVNPENGSFDPNGIGEKDFFDGMVSTPVVLSQIVESYIDLLDARGDWNEVNWPKRLVKPSPFIV